MATTNNLDQENNLCITEDAFEQFQINSMYEEDEFITLSDIAPSEDAAPIVPAEMSEIPYDNEVVLGCYAEDDSKLSNKSESKAEITEPEPSHVSDNLFPEIQCPEIGISNAEPIIKEESEEGRPRRNRIKRHAYQDCYVSSNDKNSNNESSEAESSTLPTLPSKGRRGRKPKNSNNVLSLNGSQNNETLNDVETEQQYGKKRRGRPKKNMSLEPPPPDDNVETDTILNEVAASGDTSIDNKTSSRKRGKKKHDPNNVSVANDLSKSNLEIADVSTDCDTNSKEIKTKSKRGKKLKQTATTNDVMSNEVPEITEGIGEEPESPEEDGDDICLSKLKETLDVVPPDSSERNEIIDPISTNDSNVKTEVTEGDLQVSLNENENDCDIADPQIENNVKCEIEVNQSAVEESDLLVESTSKRPVRRKTKQSFYEEDSDEDPFANVELSDDDAPRGRKGRGYSDDEYIPEVGTKGGKNGNFSDELSDSDIDFDEDFEGISKPGRRKRGPNSGSFGKSPKKRRKNSDDKNTPEVKTITPQMDDDDIEVCLQSSVIKNKTNNSMSKEFEDFIAQKIQGTNIKIKKVTASTNSSQSIEIPVLDPNEAKKYVEMSSQTNIIKTNAVAIQTSTPYDVPMKTNLALTTEQREKACEFLTSVVKTTSELGQLMTQKSDDFIAKKINTTHVTDTFKMDYCVRKSFLLFKLAKHNLLQMEEDLAKQYTEFLKNNGLESCRETEKKIEPKKKAADSDSDCEIIEAPVQSAPQKPKFNPKTVFLNKELSIKIAKKPSAPVKKETPKGKPLNIKGRHTVWINDSIQVKKVAPNQSFLAQDSRNKKPPDCYVTEEMVSNFFENYYHRQAESLLAPYVSTEWCNYGRNYVCCYYFVKSNTGSSTSIDLNQGHVSSDIEDVKLQSRHAELKSPKTLFTLSTQVLQKHLQPLDLVVNQNNVSVNSPHTLFRLCVNKLIKNNPTKTFSNYESLNDAEVSTSEDYSNQNDEQEKDESGEENQECPSPVYNTINISMDEDNSDISPLLHFESPKLLKTLCYEKLVYQPKEDMFTESDQLEHEFCYNESEHKELTLSMSAFQSPKPLKTLCFEQIVDCFKCPAEKILAEKIPECTKFPFRNVHFDENFNLKDIDNFHKDNNVKTLLTLCVEVIQRFLLKIPRDCSDQFQYSKTHNTEKVFSPFCLRHIAFRQVQEYFYNSSDILQEESKITKIHKVKRLSDITFEVVSKLTTDESNDLNSNTFEELTINAVNTLSEEAFHNINDNNLNDDNNEYLADEDLNFYNDDEYDQNYDECEDENNAEEDSSWVSKVQMQELRSVCAQAATSSKEILSNNEVSEDNIANRVAIEQNLSFAQIKVEPNENEREVDSFLDQSIVKTEPVFHEDEMTVIPESVVTKSENVEDHRHDYDGEAFETFVARNKIMHELAMRPEENDEIFSQSMVRIRRQYDPDSDNEDHESHSDMSLLVPQTFEPLHVEHAKDSLMESSSDEGSGKRATNKKKTEKRGKVKKVLPKKPDPKTNSKETSSNKEKAALAPLPPVSEVARLTRRMKDRLRQEEKKVASSESESEDMSINKRKEKDPKNNPKNSKLASDKSHDNEIQCNNVDSTANTDDREQCFTGFTAIDQNEMSSYQKYVNFVYDKILPNMDPESASTSMLRENEQNNESDSDRAASPLINPDEPIEMLECQPTMPDFELMQKPTRRRGRSKKETEKKINENAKQNIESSEKNDAITKEPPKPSESTDYVLRCGWKCYPINPKDTRLYQIPALVLEKLPESFVETYFEYQNLTSIRKEDQEVDRLINLHSLNRLSNTKDLKLKLKSKSKQSNGEQKVRDQNEVGGDDCAELTPSEDEADAADELPPLARPTNTTESCLAKNSLMDDSDSDSALSKVKKELDVDLETRKKKHKIGPKKSDEHIHPDGLMLTADKMMNKELNLLHAPVVLDEDVPESTDKAPSTKHKRKSSSRRDHTKEHVKAEDDSSSEEEKQWVSTKEKLLKRMEKKDITSVDDAKRAKLVSEFIERRGEKSRNQKRGRVRRRNLKLRMEREKQLKVLSQELYGEESTVDERRRGKLQSSSLFKGRRNIRKVIDKKSLARSTVIANMEEFERKRRLTQKQNKLCETLGCEEGVNVLVINDEVCLEYDFLQQQPVVTIHPFFTKVMKAHQYEGVKFMWDACFESLAQVGSGHPGGGCILAHCMGLGKTLQVLALLHTVLTHPGVGMQRVLVCCPLSTVLNWVDEIHKWIGPVTDKIKVFELSKLKKTYERAYQLEDWYNGGGIFIIGYELFRSLSTLDPVLDEIRPTIVNKIRTALLEPGPDIIVCDEGHLLKNDSSVLAIAMSRVQTKRRIVLTGTPMQNNLREYYCMVNFIKPNLLGTYSEYSNRFENPIMNGQHRDSQTEDIKLMKQRTHILHKVLEGCLQRQEASVLYPYLPKKHEYTLFISLTKCQWDLYKHYMACYANQNKQNILKDFHTLQKIWSHPQVLHNFQMRSRDEVGAKIKPEKLEDDLATEDLAASEDMKPNETEVWWLQHLDGGKQLDQLKSSNKFVILFRILDECIALGDKVLIFSTSLITMDSLEFFLKRINKWSLGQEYYRLDGTVPAEVRQKWCREFNAEHNHKTKLFLISTRAGSLGLNLVAANRVIILDTSWNPAHDIQSIFRVYRFGQKKDCYIYRFVALGTMEQKIYERSVTKQAVACRVVDEQQIDRHYNMGELTELYKYDEAGSGVAGGIAVGVSDVALLRVARTPALHAAHEHDSLLRGSGEAQLPEDERHALWAQFQEEQAHKQLANQLTSSFTVHQATNQKPNVKNLALNLPSTSANVPIKTEEPPAAPPPVEPKQKKKKKKGKNVTQVHIPVQSEEPQNNLPVDVDDSVVKKIMDLLIRHDFHNKQDPKDVVNLISNVRKIVAFGKIPKGAFNEELTQSIANVLLGKEQEPPPLTDVQPEPQRRGRGRPRKDAHLPTFRLPDDTESTLSASSGQEISDVEAILPSTSKQEPSIIKRQRKLKDTAIVETLTRDSDSDRPKRKAAIAASTKQTDIISDGVIDIDDDDWRDDDPEYTEPIPESPKKKEKNKPTTNASILLSDDDEPQNTVVVKTEKQKTKPSKKTEVAEKTKVSLHPSLLSNQNFIKIVAHTYLEGNPMLDEDAAILAAQYSTLKAFKEFEITGKEIDSGPIYDIAIKVLGPEILERLHKTNPPIKKVEPPKPVEKKPEMPRGKVKARVTSDLMPGAVTSLPEAVTSDLMPITPKPEILTMGRVTKTKFSVAPSGSATPSVVPVGLFKLNTAPDPQEESILPDDEDIRIVSDPTPVASPVILNNQIAEAENSHLTPRLTTQPKIIRISKPPNKKTVAAPQTKPNTIVVPVPAQNDTTICLDSDEEAPPAPTLTKSGPKRVALKSTAKKQAPARPEVVPVSLTAAAPPILPKLTRLPPEPQIVQHSVIDPTTGISTSKNFVMIPADQLLNTLNKGVAPHFMQNSTQISVTQNPSLGVGPQIVYANPMMNRNLQPTYVIPGTTNVMASVPQNVNMVQSMPYNMLPQGAPLGQNLHLLNAQPLMSPAVPAPHAPPAPPAAPPAPPAIAPATSKPLKKTLCKPGDILRITDTGQVEILNREEEEKKKAPPKPKKPPKKPTRKIMRSSSSSSSSSDDLVAEPVPTRAENNDHDPLAILRDVVHIKAVDDYEEPAPKKRVSRELIGTSVAKTIDTSISKTFGDTSITKTFGNKTTNKTFGNKPNSTTFGNTSITKAAPNKKPPTRSDQTRPANSLLKNLDSMLTPSKSKTSKSSTQKFHGSVDLTIVPSTSGTQKKSTTQNKVMSSITSINKKATPSKIVGTSDNIIISGKGKTMSLKQGNTPSINVTSMKTVQPAKSWNDPKKRPAAQADSGATKKRKTEPMTLKDFDIDDIDDIIELD